MLLVSGPFMYQSVELLITAKSAKNWAPSSVKIPITKSSLEKKFCRLNKAKTDLIIQSTNQEIHCKYLINCSGLHSDRMTKMSGQNPTAKIIPFKGEYYFLSKHAEKFCNHLIYPVPDPKFPFLGVHFTRMIEGGVECGPNAVLAFGREAYEKFSFNPGDFFESITYPGFQIMAMKHWKMGWGEMWRSFSKKHLSKPCKS